MTGLKDPNRLPQDQLSDGLPPHGIVSLGLVVSLRLPHVIDDLRQMPSERDPRDLELLFAKTPSAEAAARIPAFVTRLKSTCFSRHFRSARRQSPSRERGLSSTFDYPNGRSQAMRRLPYVGLAWLLALLAGGAAAAEVLTPSPLEASYRPTRGLESL
jgi:hypothetical protein